MKDRNYTLPAARLTQLNDRIVGLYRAAREKNALEAVIDTMSELIPGELHLAFTTKSNGEVSFATSAGSEGDHFIMATMSAAESHPLIYQTDREVSAISDVLSTREWQCRDMYHLASPFVKMADSLGTDMRIAPDTTFSTCVIRDGRSFRDDDRSGLHLMIPHFLSILEMNGNAAPNSDRFHILPLQSLPCSIRALHRLLRELPNVCSTVSVSLADWIFHHRTTGPLSPQSLSFRSSASGCSAVFIPPGRQCEGAVAIRHHPVVAVFSSAHPLLTRRENEVGHWLCAGKANAEIAIILDITPGTVKRHLENIYEKLGVPNRVSAATLIRESIG
jgi:DNA-binding CsgD family transcriptional regulator